MTTVKTNWYPLQPYLVTILKALISSRLFFKLETNLGTKHYCTTAALIYDFWMVLSELSSVYDSLVLPELVPIGVGWFVSIIDTISGILGPIYGYL